MQTVRETEMEKGSGGRSTRNNVCAGLGFALEVFCEQWYESVGILNMFLDENYLTSFYAEQEHIYSLT